MEFDLTPFFTTKGQATDFLTRLSALSEEVYHIDFSVERAAMKHLGVRKGELFLKLLKDHGVTLDSDKETKAFIDKIQSAIRELNILTITIAFEPDESTFQALSEWFLINLKKQFILEISVNPAIIAGAAINYKGTYLDCSIKQLFEKIAQESHMKATPTPETHKQTIEHFHLGR